MDKKPGKARGKQGKTIRELPLSSEQASHVKGGAADIFAKLGDIKGESIDDPKLDPKTTTKLRFR